MHLLTLNSEMTKDNLPLKTKLAFGIGSTGEAATNWVFSGLVFFYYNQIIGLPGTLTGIGVFIAMMFDAISDPLVGSISDRFKSKYGRRHPFMFFAPIPTSIALICIFYPPDAMSTFGLFTWFLFSTIFLRLSITMFTVPHLALGAELSDDYIERSKVMSFNNIFNYGGWVIMHIFVWIIVFPNYGGDKVGQLVRESYLPIISFTVVLVTVCILVSAIFTRDRIPLLKKPSSDLDEFNFKNLFLDIKGALSNKNYQNLLLGLLFLAVLIGTHETLSIYMATFFWELSPIQIGYLVLNNIIGYGVGFAITAKLHDKFDKPLVIFVSVFVLTIFWSLPIILGLLGAAPQNSSTELVIFLISIYAIASASGSILNISVMSALADITDEHELKTGKRQEGIFYAARAFFSKASNGMGQVVAGLCLDIINFPRNAIPGEIPRETIIELGYIDGPFAMIWGFIALIFYKRYKINKAYHDEIKAELMKRI